MLKLINTDIDRWTITDDTLISDSHNLTVFDYLHGRCHIFAIALKKLMGDRAEIFCVIDCDQPDSEIYLSHAYVLIDNKTLVDARGVISEHEIDNYTCDLFDFEIVSFTVEQMIPMTTGQYWGSEQQGEFEAIMSFIRQHPTAYQLDNIDRDPSILS